VITTRLFPAQGIGEVCRSALERGEGAGGAVDGGEGGGGGGEPVDQELGIPLLLFALQPRLDLTWCDVGPLLFKNWVAVQPGPLLPPFAAIQCIRGHKTDAEGGEGGGGGLRRHIKQLRLSRSFKL